MSGRFCGSLHYIMMIIADKQLTITHTVGFSIKNHPCLDAETWVIDKRPYYGYYPL